MTAGQIEAHRRRRTPWEEGPLVGPQRHQMGDRGAVLGGGADDGHPRRLRPSLRPDRERAAAPTWWPAKLTTRKRSANSRCGRPPRSAWNGAGHSRLLPAVPETGQAGDRQVGGRRGAGTRRGRRLDGAGLSAGRTDRAAARSRDGAAVPVRPVDLLPAPSAAAVRLPLPHRDLRARTETPIRLLRLAFYARRAASRPRRPEGGTHAGRAACRRRLTPRTDRSRRGSRPRWPPNCSRWRRGWAWLRSLWGSGATWRPICAECWLKSRSLG